MWCHTHTTIAHTYVDNCVSIFGKCITQAISYYHTIYISLQLPILSHSLSLSIYLCSSPDPYVLHRYRMQQYYTAKTTEGLEKH